MSWIYLICSNFITFRLNIKLLLAQHIPLPGLYIAGISLRTSDGFTVLFFRDVAMPQTDNRLPLLTFRTQLNTVLSEAFTVHKL